MSVETKLTISCVNSLFQRVINIIILNIIVFIIPSQHRPIIGNQRLCNRNRHEAYYVT
jgi:hypothetical protein